MGLTPWRRLSAWVLKDVHWPETFAVPWARSIGKLGLSPSVIAASFEVPPRLLGIEPGGFVRWPQISLQRIMADMFDFGIAPRIGIPAPPRRIVPERANLVRTPIRTRARRQAAEGWKQARIRASKAIWPWTDEGWDT